MPLSFLLDLKDSGKVKNVKYTWIEVELIKRKDYFRLESLIPKLPHKFYYRFTDNSGKTSRLMIEDWVIGASAHVASFQ